jgi:hypothetical protein
MGKRAWRGGREGETEEVRAEWEDAPANLTRHASHLICRITRHTPHLPRHTCHVAHHTSRVTRHTCRKCATRRCRCASDQCASEAPSTASEPTGTPTLMEWQGGAKGEERRGRSEGGGGKGEEGRAG